MPVSLCSDSDCKTAVSSIESTQDRPCPSCGAPLRALDVPEPREPETPVKR